ncbi:MAG: type II secretion system protein GspN [Bdellovibrionota bacterium]
MPVDTLDTNLLSSRGKRKSSEDLPEEPIAPATPRKKAMKLAAYCVIFLVSLIFFMIMKIPDSTVTNLTLAQLNANTPYNWRADKVGFRLFFLPHLVFEKLELEPKFQAGGGFSVATMKIYPGLLSLIPMGGAPNFRGSFSAEAYQGNFSGSFALGNNSAFSTEVENLDLAKFTPLSQAGVDLKGVITSLVADLTMESQRLSRSDGTVRASGKNIVFDPGSLQLPIAVPIMDLGPLEFQAKILRGKLKIEKLQAGGPTKDLELRIEGDVQLSEPINFSRLDLHLRLKPSDKIMRAIPALQGMLTSLAAKRADGFYGMKLSGTLAAMGLPQPDP